MQTEIDGKPLEEVRKLAERQSRSEKEVLDEAVKKYLARSDPRRFEELLGERSSRFDLAEEEAERMAYEELHAMKRGRKARPQPIRHCEACPVGVALNQLWEGIPPGAPTAR